MRTAAAAIQPASQPASQPPRGSTLLADIPCCLPLCPSILAPQGAESEYCGEAVNPKHLSFLEKFTGYGKLYNPKAADDLSGGDQQQQGSESKEAFIVTSPTSALVGGGSANGASGKAPTL